MNSQAHIYIAQVRADELHRAAAISRLVPRRTWRGRVTGSRGYGVVARRVCALRGAPGLAR